MTSPDSPTKTLSLQPRHQLNDLKPEHFDLPKTLARLCISRGVTHMDELDLSIKKIHPARQMLGLDTAVSIMDNAIDTGESILIVGDFDADGATSTALMIRVLSKMGANVNFLVPDRFKFGYGLTPEIVTHGIETFQPDLIITVDNGISSHDGVARAQENGVKVIITDHHLTSKAKPPAEAVVNPNQLGCEFPSKALAGVGVAFYILASLAKKRRLAGKSSDQVTQYLDIVALGTVADVASLDANNRRLVANGLNQINQKSCCLGILALLSVAGKEYNKLQSQDLGFILGPRINAAGRMDDMRIGIKCLLADDWDTALMYAKKLDALNLKRRQVESKIRDEAESVIEEKGLIDALDTNQHRSMVLYDKSWHQGVIGIVAGRLKEKYHKPSIVFAPSDDSLTSLKGSARSIAGVHIRDAIEQVAQTQPTLISHFGGHAMAAGLSIKPENFTAFAQAFETVLQSMDASIFNPVTYTDGRLEQEDFQLDFAHQLKYALPWGHGFVTPAFDGVFYVDDFKILKEKHLKLWLKHTADTQNTDATQVIEAIYFNYDMENWDASAQKIHALYELDVNHFRGNASLQLMIKDMAVIKHI